MARIGTTIIAANRTTGIMLVHTLYGKEGAGFYKVRCDLQTGEEVERKLVAPYDLCIYSQKATESYGSALDTGTW